MLHIFYKNVGTAIQLPKLLLHTGQEGVGLSFWTPCRSLQTNWDSTCTHIQWKRGIWKWIYSAVLCPLFATPLGSLQQDYFIITGNVLSMQAEVQLHYMKLPSILLLKCCVLKIVTAMSVKMFSLWVKPIVGFVLLYQLCLFFYTWDDNPLFEKLPLESTTCH